MKFKKFNDVSLMIEDLLPEVQAIYGEQSTKRNQMLLELSKAYREQGLHEEACSAAQSIVKSLSSYDASLIPA